MLPLPLQAAVVLLQVFLPELVRLLQAAAGVLQAGVTLQELFPKVLAEPAVARGVGAIAAAKGAGRTSAVARGAVAIAAGCCGTSGCT